MIERYQTPEMTALWSQEATFERWTRVELECCRAWHRRGRIDANDMHTLNERCRPPSPGRVREIEEVTHHDMVAFVRALAEVVNDPASRHLHLGLTSSDVIDTAQGMALVVGLRTLADAATELRAALWARAQEHRDTICAGRTHGVHAEPTSFGLRLAGHAAEMQRNVERLHVAAEAAAYGKLSGVVGTYSQADPEIEAEVLGALGLRAEPVATQVVPRDRYAAVAHALCLTGAGVERLALEVRGLQRTEIREVEEPFDAGQTGSSAMPHKRNPILSERLCGMARLLRAYAHTAYENVALWHDRDISHSSTERVWIPDAFHITHSMLRLATRIVTHMRIFPERMRGNLDGTRGLVYSQSVLGALLDAGLQRQDAYALVQSAAAAVLDGQADTFAQALAANPRAAKHLSPAALAALCDPMSYLRHAGHIFARTEASFTCLHS